MKAEGGTGRDGGSGGWHGAPGGGGRVIIVATDSLIATVGGAFEQYIDNGTDADYGGSPETISQGKPTIVVKKVSLGVEWKRDYIYSNGQLTATVEKP